MITLSAVGIISFSGEILMLNGVDRRVMRSTLVPLQRDGDNIVLEFWGKAADRAKKVFKVGSTVYITGEPIFSTYPKKDGTPGMEIKVRNPVVQIIYEKKRNEIELEKILEEKEEEDSE